MMTITAETSSVPGFVAELVRAANEVDRLTAGEIESLLLRARAALKGRSLARFSSGCRDRLWCAFEPLPT
ncbi:hypothetical protein GFL91_13930 [Rhizobium leguminosarum bv. viciae]|uniref:Uncharacterized protein n=1 Tax=Rhizobium leguminosarum bv. viciae TaxID=387 RepID=A0A8I2GQI3_RHILV|nr:hypothetical protein [Rhizobium leguminosarum bv. viciae]